MYPVLFKPIVKKMIWGSESWDITCRPNETGVIENGESPGESFEKFIARDAEKILGTKIANKKRFPLLIKIIDARDALSVQVHPDDTYAKFKGESDSGKSEMWYILSPPDDGFLIIGLNHGVTKEQLAAAYKNGTVESCLNRLHVREGDIVNIPAGLVHALTPGSVVAEVQQNSDITYRLFDYNRLGADGQPRALHVEDALAVADFDGKIPREAVRGEIINRGGAGDFTVSRVVSCEYFDAYKYEISGAVTEVSDVGAFSVFTCVHGGAVVETPQMKVEVPARRSVFIPAALGEYTLRPTGECAVLLKSTPR